VVVTGVYAGFVGVNVFVIGIVWIPFSEQNFDVETCAAEIELGTVGAGALVYVTVIMVVISTVWGLGTDVVMKNVDVTGCVYSGPVGVHVVVTGIVLTPLEEQYAEDENPAVDVEVVGAGVLETHVSE
jgi:hypothetical protein